MAVPVVILHGYGGGPKGWEAMADGLLGRGAGPVSHAFLGEFETKEDDLVYGDLSEGLHQELAKLAPRLGGLAPRSFSIIAHSTGALVVRHWLQRYYGDSADAVPLRHLILLAPANFGSRLAHHGNAEYGRFLHFLRERRWEGWETGRNILNGLELASPFTWDLVMGDVLKPSGLGLNADGLYTFVIIGNKPYTGRIQRRFPARAEAGSDGTVRVAAAALNSRRLDIDFAKRPLEFSVTGGYAGIPLAVVPKVNHSSIKKDQQVLDLVAEVLRVDSHDAFIQAKTRFDSITRGTNAGTSGRQGHEYQQFVVRVVDDTGSPVTDYDFDFEVYDRHGREARKFSDKFNQTKKHIHTYSGDASYRCFFIDCTELGDLGARLPDGHSVYLSMIAMDISGKVRYQTSNETRVPLLGPKASGQDAGFFHGNTTTLVQITLDRKARDELFTIRERIA